MLGGRWERLGGREQEVDPANVVCHDRAVEHFDAPVCSVGDRLVVGDQHDRRSGVRFVSQQVGDPFAGRLVEAAGRLVGNDQLRLRHDRPSDGDTLLLATAELAGKARGLLTEPDDAQRFDASFQAVSPGDLGSAQLDRQFDVFCSGEGREEMKILEDDADGAPPPASEHVVLHLVDAFAVDHE